MSVYTYIQQAVMLVFNSVQGVVPIKAHPQNQIDQKYFLIYRIIGVFLRIVTSNT